MSASERSAGRGWDDRTRQVAELKRPLGYVERALAVNRPIPGPHLRPPSRHFSLQTPRMIVGRKIVIQNLKERILSACKAKTRTPITRVSAYCPCGRVHKFRGMVLWSLGLPMFAQYPRHSTRCGSVQCEGNSLFSLQYWCQQLISAGPF